MDHRPTQQRQQHGGELEAPVVERRTQIRWKSGTAIFSPVPWPALRPSQLISRLPRARIPKCFSQAFGIVVDNLVDRLLL